MDNEVTKGGLKNTIFVVLAQSVSLILGIARTIILPILLGVTNFGYWQVYLLYMSYVGVFAMGFNDGIYLRYGKYNYLDLPKSLFRSSIKLFVISQFIIMFLVSLLIILEHDPNKQISMLWAAFNIPIAGLMGVLIYILQITNQLKKYSYYTVLDKLIALLLITFIYYKTIDNFIVVIIADTLSRIFVLFLICYSCRDILFGKGSGFVSASKELYKNISVGIKLMLANFAGMLVLGIGRFIVERFDSIEVYATYSFAVSTLNIILVFISAIGLVVYPTLNRLDENKFPKYFIELGKMINIIVFGLLISYFPLYIFIGKFLNNFTQVFEYLPIIFSVIFIQSKMQILINPYYKLLREEKAMLKANIVGLLMSIMFIVPLYIVYKSVLMVAIGTSIAMGLRLYLSEVYLKRILIVRSKYSSSVVEVIGVMVFIFFAYQPNVVIGFTGYLIFFCIYLSFNKQIIENFIKTMK